MLFFLILGMQIISTPPEFNLLLIVPAYTAGDEYTAARIHTIPITSLRRLLVRIDLHLIGCTMAK